MKKIVSMLLVSVFMLSMFAVPASAREVVSYYFTLYERNESDGTGCFDYANGYKVKQTTDIPAAIRVDQNSGYYDVKTTLNINQGTRATDFSWQGSYSRKTPNYINRLGVRGQSYILWVRRNAAENSYSTYITGSWSPDSY